MVIYAPNIFRARKPSSRDDWETPKELYNLLNSCYEFEVDAAASDENHLYETYWTEKDDGLKQDWTNKIIFCNPPFCNKANWIAKAKHESENNGAIVVMILPVDTGTTLWHNYIMYAKTVYLLTPRVNYLLHGKKQKNGAPFPTTVIIFDGLNFKADFESLRWKEDDAWESLISRE